MTKRKRKFPIAGRQNAVDVSSTSVRVLEQVRNHRCREKGSASNISRNLPAMKAVERKVLQHGKLGYEARRQLQGGRENRHVFHPSDLL